MLYFVTSNKNKLFLARKNLQPLEIEIDSLPFESPEIQSDNTDEIATKKAIDAYAVIQKPLFITDDSWFITALRGFPGAYMKYMTDWLTAEDFLRLVEPYENREVILRQTICFTDGTKTKLFSQDNKGILLKEPSGKNVPIFQIASFSKSGKSAAEMVEKNENPIDNVSLWKNFGKWYLSRKEKSTNQ